MASTQVDGSGAIPLRVAVAGAVPLRVAVAGASGRMGRMLIEAVLAADDMRLAAAFDIVGSPSLGQDACAFLGRASGVDITAGVRAGLSASDVLIDFTRPEGTLAHLALCRELGVKVVIGTTGFDDAQRALIADHAEHIAVMMAPNMSVGVNVVLKLLDMAARALNVATTSRSSKPTTATRSTPRAAPRSRWAASSRRRWAAT